MILDEVILELYRLAETRKWNGQRTDKALFAAIEGMEHLLTIRLADKRRSAKANTGKKQPRLWS